MCALLWFSFLRKFLLWSLTTMWNFLSFWSVIIHDAHGEKEGWLNYQYTKVKMNGIRKSVVWWKQKEGMTLSHWYWGVGINDFTFVYGREDVNNEIRWWESRRWFSSACDEKQKHKGLIPELQRTEFVLDRRLIQVKIEGWKVWWTEVEEAWRWRSKIEGEKAERRSNLFKVID